MKFVNLRHRNRKPSYVSIKVPDIKFSIDSMSCDLKKGVIKVKPGETDVVQHIALAFVTSTLYLLVQPRPPEIPIKSRERRGAKTVRNPILKTYTEVQRRICIVQTHFRMQQWMFAC